jgi:Endomembrane protein 70
LPSKWYFIPLDYYRLIPYHQSPATDYFDDKYMNQSNPDDTRLSSPIISIHGNDNNKTQFLPKLERMNLGQPLLGECTSKSSFDEIIVGKNLNCQEIGVSSLDYKTWQPVIEAKYSHNWMLDNFRRALLAENIHDSAKKIPKVDNENMQYHQQFKIVLVQQKTHFPVGTVKIYNDGTRQVAINNHFHITITLREAKNTHDDSNKDQPLYRVIGFDVQPSSQPHYYDARLRKILSHCSILPVRTNSLNHSSLQSKRSWKIQVSNGPVSVYVRFKLDRDKD